MTKNSFLDGSSIGGASDPDWLAAYIAEKKQREAEERFRAGRRRLERQQERDAAIERAKKQRKALAEKRREAAAGRRERMRANAFDPNASVREQVEYARYAADQMRRRLRNAEKRKEKIGQIGAKPTTPSGTPPTL